MKKNILIAAYNLNYGGIETSLINLLKNINIDKYNVTLALEKKEGVFLNEVPKEIKIKEYKVNTSSNIFLRKVFNLTKRIKWLLLNYKRYDASISYATYSKPCSFLARTSSKNNILFVHSNYVNAYRKDISKIKEFFNGIRINEYNHIVFVSNEAKKDLCKIYKDIESRSVTINNLVDYNKIIKLSKEKINIDKNYNKVFLFVGRLDETSKRLTLLLDIAKKCKKDKVSAEFWIVGDGKDEIMYKEIVRKEKLNNVTFFGAKKNPYPYMLKSDYIILTSIYEGFPVIYNEAIILNKPIITTIDVTDDYISIPNRFGYVVNEKNIYNKVKELTTKKDEVLKEKVDYGKLNKERIKLIEDIMER